MDLAQYHSDPPKDIFAPKAGERRLSIGIIGAGIAGLSAAIGLTKSGHDVEVFERSRFNNEVGAAINCSPNAMRILRYWGFDSDQAHPSDFAQQHFMKGDDLSTIFFGEHSHWPARYGAPGYLFHRVDLHEGLKNLAQRSPSSGEGTAKMHLATAATAIDTEKGTITLASGETITKDLIVVADGVHSLFVQDITGGEMEALQTGTSTFRFLIPTKKLLENEQTRPLFENVPGGIRVAVCGDTRIVWYPCRNYTFQNGLVIHPTSHVNTNSPTSSSTSSTDSGSSSRATNEKESWHNSMPVSSLLSIILPRGFHPSLVAFCAAAEDLRLWPLIYRPPIQNWFKGKAVLIGDAAHPMLTHQGQAGAQAMEDSAALSAVLSHLPPSSSSSQPLSSTLTHRLTLFQRIRRPRAAAMQIFSNAGQDQGQFDEAVPFLEEMQKGEGEVRLPRGPDDFHEWNLSWNCWRESAEVMREEGGVGGLEW